MPSLNRCSECGAEIPGQSPAGQCPRCLLRAGFASEDAGFASEDDVQPQVETKSSGAPVARFEPLSVEQIAPLFPHLEILELLGQGGMGAVYKARQRDLDRLIAVKVLPREFDHDPDFAERFTREARAMARVNHPNIVAIHDFGQREGQFFLVMEYIDGVNLRQAMQAKQLSPEEALAIVPQICDALQYAHDEGIIHRDIKPENILLDSNGHVKIADFGLAKIRTTDEDTSQITLTNQVMGTPNYMAPEQWKQTTSVDHRADIYSLGVVFYELLTGELPIGRFPAPSETVEVNVKLDHVVLKALETDPQRRYQHASQVKKDITETASYEFPATEQKPSKEPQAPPHFDPFNPYWEGYLARVAQTKFADLREKVRIAYRRRQFGLRTLLIAVALLAITLAIGMAVYKNFTPRREFVYAVQISIEPATPQSNVSTAKEFVTRLEQTTLSEWLLRDPDFLKIPAVQAEADPKSWLVEHLLVRDVESDERLSKMLLPGLKKRRGDNLTEAAFLDVRFVIDAKAISKSDLTAILDESVQAIRARAIDADLKAVVADRTYVMFQWDQ